MSSATETPQFTEIFALRLVPGETYIVELAKSLRCEQVERIRDEFVALAPPGCKFVFMGPGMKIAREA